MILSAHVLSDLSIRSRQKRSVKVISKLFLHLSRQYEVWKLILTNRTHWGADPVHPSAGNLVSLIKQSCTIFPVFHLGRVTESAPFYISTMYISTILHEFRKKHELSMNEFAVIEWFYKKGQNSVGGWVDYTLEECADELYLAKSTVHAAVSTAVNKGFMKVKNRKNRKVIIDNWV